MNHPTQTPRLLIAAIAGLAMAATTQMSFAQQSPDHADATRVEITAPMPVRTACPAVDVDLPDALIKAWNDVHTPGTVTVQFKLEGDHISDVTTLSGSQRYFRSVRRAVQGLDCDGRDDRVHVVTLEVAFVFPDDGHESTAAATIVSNIASNQ